jgi:hypothetical protein
MQAFLLLHCRLVLRLHGVDDDRDEEIQHREGGDEDVRNEEQPGVGMHLHDRLHDAVDPAFERHDGEQRERGPAEISELLGKFGPEQLRRHHGEHVEQQQQQQQQQCNRTHAGERRDQSAHHAPQRRHDGDESKDAQHAKRTQHRQVLRRRHDRDRHHHEVEHAPRVAEEGEPVHGNARGDLDHENGEDQAIQRVQERAGSRHDGRARLQSQDRGVYQDEREDGPFGPGILEQDAKAIDHGFAPGPAEKNRAEYREFDVIPV